jgi:hypothetical protein
MILKKIICQTDFKTRLKIHIIKQCIVILIKNHFKTKFMLFAAAALPLSW